MGVQVREKIEGSGVYWVFINHHGKRKSKKIGSKKTAEEVAKKIEARLVLGDVGLLDKADEEVPTFKEYVEVFIETFSKLNHKPTTIESYKSVLKKHILPAFGKKRLNEIQRKDIKAFVIKKQNSGYSPNTVRIARAYLSSVLTQAVDDEIIDINPASNTGRYIKKVQTDKIVNPFTWEEKTAFEQAVQEHFPRYYTFFICALRTGMREGELIALKPGDIDFNGGFIEVRRNKVRKHLLTPKSGKSRRVDMTGQLALLFKTYLTERKKEALRKGWGEPPEWLFYNEAGGMIDIANFRKRVFYNCLEKAGLRRIRLHDLRSTYATLRIQAGHNIADVSKQLGHHSIKVTVDTYYKWIPGSNRVEVNELDRDSAPARTLYAPSGEKDTKKGLAD